MTRRRRTSRRARWLLLGAAALAVLAAAGLALVPLVVDTPRIQALAAGAATQALGRPVRCRSVSLSVFPLPSVVLRQLEVDDDAAFGRPPFVVVDEVRVRLRLWPLLRLRVELGDVVLKEPAVALVRAADGRWNVATLGVPEARPPARARAGSGGTGGAVAAASLLGARIRIEDAAVSVEMRGSGRPVRYRLEDVDAVVETGGPGALGFRTTARVMPGAVEVKVTDGTLDLGQARTLMDAPLRGRLTVEGGQVRDLLATALGPEPALSGHPRAALALAGTVGRPTAQGEIALADVAVTRAVAQCPAPDRRTLTLGPVAVAGAWEGETLSGRPVTTSLAGGAISANVTATLDAGLRVAAEDVAVKGVRVEVLLVDFLCQGFAVTGPLDLTGVAAARADQPWTTLEGTGRFRIGPGRVVGSQAVTLLDQVARFGGALSSALRGEAPLTGSSPLEYESITGTYRIAAGVVRTTDLTLTGRALRLTAAGTYALATGALDFDTRVRVGGGELRARVSGTAASPSIRVAPPGSLRDAGAGTVQRGFEELLRHFR